MVQSMLSNSKIQVLLYLKLCTFLALSALNAFLHISCYFQLTVPKDTNPETILEQFQNWTDPFSSNDGAPVVIPKLIDVGPHIVREFVGEVDVFTPNISLLPKDDFTDLVSFKIAV